MERVPDLSPKRVSPGDRVSPEIQTYVPFRCVALQFCDLGPILLDLHNLEKGSSTDSSPSRQFKLGVTYSGFQLV